MGDEVNRRFGRLIKKKVSKATISFMIRFLKFFIICEYKCEKHEKDETIISFRLILLGCSEFRFRHPGNKRASYFSFWGVKTPTQQFC
jgi:hypothetical protein